MNTDVPPAFATLVRRYRLQAGMSQEQLAARAGLSVGAISTLERGVRRAPHRDTVALLAEALALTPDQRTQFHAAVSRARRPAPPPTRQVPSTGNLPTPVTTFVGRDQEQATVHRLLAATRLLTLTGTGGVGKTRLAAHVAATLTAAYPDGIRLVELGALTDPALIPQAAVQALGMREQPDKPVLDTLTEALRGRALLLLLDNCEHLLPAAREVAETLLRACPGVRILATSRQALGALGETVWWVPSMSVPSSEFRVPGSSPPHSELGTRNSELEQSDAVRLFVARAAAAQPAFALTDATAPAVATICQRLDGIPLAIELAAARTRILTPAQIAARLDERFRLLTGGSPDAPSRHQTLRLALDWSYDLLSEPEQRLLQRLSVFAGGCDLDAAEVVCAVDDPSADPSPTRRGKAHSTAVDQAPPSLRGKGAEGLGRSALVDLLTSLVDKSLVTLDYRGEAARYRLLETVRQYAVERLAASGEAESLRRRHGVWALDLAERAASLLDGPDQTDWLDQLDAEHDNLRAALAWALDSGEGTLGLQLAGALAAFWEFRGHLAEGRRWLTLALVAGRIAPPAIRTRAAGGAGNLARMQGDLTAARALYEESLDFARAEGDRAATALALNQLGIVSLFEGDFTAARTLFEQSLTIRRAIGDTFGMARTLNNLGLLAREQGDIATARTFYEQSMPLMRAAGDRRGVAGVLLNLGTIARDQGDLAAARSLLQESLSLFGERGDKASVSAVLNNLAVVVTEQGDFAEATSLHHQSLTLKQELGDRSGIAHSLEELAWIAARSGTPERAARLFGVAEALRHAIGTPLAPIERERHDRAVTDVRGTLAGPVFAAGWAEGAAMSPDDAIAYALANTGPPAPSPLPIPSPGES